MIIDQGSFLEFTLNEEDAGRPVGNILRSKYGFSRGMIRKLKKHQGVYLNGLVIRLNDAGKEGDLIRVCLREKEESWIVPQCIPLKVVYEDEDLLIVNKEAGMLVHPNSYQSSGSLANAVLYRWKCQGISALFRPVFRIDRNTSGLVMVAKNRHTSFVMAEQMKTNKMRRRYLAVAQGQIEANEGII